MLKQIDTSFTTFHGLSWHSQNNIYKFTEYMHFKISVIPSAVK